ncbi:MAG: MATE family efflux transporter [Parabacteroides sp.]
MGLLAQNIINVTDTAFLGHVGEVELGASAMGGLYYICVFTIAFGFSMGSQILIARRNGERNYAAIGPVMVQGVVFLLLLAAFLFAFSRLFVRDVMRLLISSDTILETTTRFLEWRVYGFFFIFVGVMFRALFIGITRTKVLTLNSLVMACSNVLLDYGLIFGHWGLPRMGVEGAAIASVISEGISVLFYVVYTYLTVDRQKYALTRFRRLDVSLLRHILGISIFTMLQYLISMFTFFMLFVVVEHLGQRSLAVANIIRSLYVVMLIPVNTLSMTTNTLVSNVIGEGHRESVLPLIRRITLGSMGIMAVCVLLLVVAPRLWISFYTNEPELVEASVPVLYVLAVALMASAASNIVFSGVSGTGNTKVAMYIELGTLLFYSLAIYQIGIRWQMPVAMCFWPEVLYYVGLLSASSLYLRRGNWQEKQI